jgi:long-chain acyl-CoA synthetase
VAEQFANLVELVETCCARFAERPLFGTKKDGAWRWTTYGQFGALVDRVRAGLAGLGVGRGDRVAIIADNRIEWAAAAYATYGLEAAFVPMYPAQKPGEWRFIIADCGASVVLAGNEAIYDVLLPMRSEVATVRHVIGLERPDADPDSWASLIAAGEKKPVPSSQPPPDSIAGFIYTSGTTGKPKGALLSHKNIASNVNGVHEIFPLTENDVSLSFLPWAHSFGQTCELHMIVSFGASTAVNDDLNRLLPNLAEVKPTVLMAVPRIFNRIYEAVNAQIAERPGFLQRIIRTGMRGAIKRAQGEKLGTLERLELAFDDKVVFGKIRQRFGGRLKYAVSGSASLGLEVAQFIDALGITVYEGYGLTETSPIVSANRPGARRLGSVGKVLPGVRVELDKEATGNAKEGEIIVYGPNVMKGYHARPAENEQAFTKDGGLRTGDIGYFDDDGYLFISGRIKEQYKLENGKYVMPSPLEEELKLSPYIANVMLYGDGKPHNVALVAISVPAVQAWAEKSGASLNENPDQDERVRALIAAEIEKHTHEFKGYEKPRAFALVREDFTTENGLLTPTMKLKRREVMTRYGTRIAALYAAASTAATAAKA